ncbi:DUF3263 domain-containing protein [Rhizocola hellebori]|uniref:DUF3263 domain-containing protein n=1 Tax=Rhizocola hellebori TaxID=1392758 RepID=UPI003570A40D
MHQRKRHQHELGETLKTTSPQAIPAQQRRLIDDEVDTDLAAKAVPTAVPVAPDRLSEREQSILDFEKQWWRHAGSKEQAIRDRFELSGTRYYQILNGLLDKPAALEHDPVLVGRLRRLRGSRARARGR